MSGDAAMAEAARSTDLYQGMVAERRRGDPGRGQGRHPRRDVRRHPRRERADDAAADPPLPAGDRAGRGGRPRGRARRGGAHPARPGLAGAHRRVGGAAGRPGRAARRRRRHRRTPTATAAPGAGSPATSSSRAPARSGRCAGWPTCATGCGGWAAAGTVERAAAPGLLPARRGGRPHARAPGRGRRPTRSGAPRPRPAGCCSARSRSTSRSTWRSSDRGPTPAEISGTPARTRVGRRPWPVRCLA